MRASAAIVACLAVFPACAANTVVLIGGAKSEGPARHEYAHGVRLLERFLRDSPDVRRQGLAVAAHPEGWPRDARALDDAATVVWYFDGLDHHPLADAARAKQVRVLLRRGVGVVALHQAATVPEPGFAFDVASVLGGVRRGMADRVTDIVRLRVGEGAHPVTRGLADFAYHDELFPTLHFPQPAKVTPVLRGEGFTAAWTFERPDGGRSFTFTGAHYLAALDQPQVRRLLLNAIVWTAGREVPMHGIASGDPDAAMQVVRPLLASIPRHAARDASAPDTLTFHRDARRTGWHAAAGIRHEHLARFGLAWESPPLAGHGGQPARLYASPLYMQHVPITAGAHRGAAVPVVFAATSSADVYAIAAGGGVAPGTILWKTRLTEPCSLKPAPLDGVPTGVLATPVIDSRRGRIYVTSCDEKQRWQAFALDLGSGAVLPGWPVTLDEGTFNRVNRNAGPEPVPPRRKHDFRVQRGALNLSYGGRLLHVAFGESETGWIASVDTEQAQVASAFAGAAMPHRGSAGMWGAGGAAVANDEIYVATGTGYDGFKDQPHDWTQSVLQLAHGAGGYELRGTYTPFNHCVTALNDIDLGSGGVMLPPDRDWATTATPRLLALGGKQGNAYLVDRLRMPGRLDRRPPCTTDASSDRSLLAPQPQPQFGTRGPLNVFGPYSEKDAAMDIARARSLPAYYEDAKGRGYLFVTGNQKRAEGSAESVPPSLARLALVAEPGERAWLRIDQAQMKTVLRNPGSPVVTSNGHGDAIVWVLDENAPRSALLSAGPKAPRPVLYAFDAMTLELLWRSGPGVLGTSGKYNEPAFAAGMAIVGTDRIQAFGAGGRARPAVQHASPQAEGMAAREPRPAADNYRERCAACHDQPNGSIPPREVLARRSKAHIVEVLTHGAMRPYAQGLAPSEIEALAEHLR